MKMKRRNYKELMTVLRIQVMYHLTPSQYNIRASFVFPFLILLQCTINKIKIPFSSASVFFLFVSLTHSPTHSSDVQQMSFSVWCLNSLFYRSFTRILSHIFPFHSPLTFIINASSTELK